MQGKLYRVVLFLIICIVFSLSLCACDRGESDVPSDDVGNGKAEFDNSLYLSITSQSKPMVTIVSAYSKAKEVAAAYNTLISEFKSAGITFNTSYEASDDPDLPEILIGDRIGASKDTYIDPHRLGEDGYTVRVVGNKVIIAGGSASSLAEAINVFGRDVLKLTDTSVDINNLAVPRTTNITFREDYPITSITIGQNDLWGYDIVCDTDNAQIFAAATKLRDIIYDNSGYWLNIKSESKNPSIRINLTQYTSGDGFMVFVENEDLVIECAFPLLFENSFDKFVSDFFTSTEKRDIYFSSKEVYTQMISKVFYSDYGAVGDGVTDDYFAIKAAHDAANITGQTVVADMGKTYNLGVHYESIVIKTDVIWTNASFIIDDSNISPDDRERNSNVFTVDPDYAAGSVKGISSLKKGQTNIGVTFGSSVMLHIVCSDKKQYIRYGANADAGADQQEIILVDKDGNVDPSTPIMWDYPTLTYVTAYPIDDKPITIKGGMFTTVANAAPREYTYYKRGIAIRRSNVTIDGLYHNITGEGSTGAPYNGFLAISYCNNILVENTTLTGHKVYKLSSDVNNSMGTYDITIGSSNNIVFRNCKQTNDITDTAYWGIMGSNYCKNLMYDTCVFSRFDAHKGTHNATIINSEIGHQKLSVIGSGTLLVENTIIHGNSIAALRSDYGSTWEGDMIFRNVTLKNTGTVTLISGSWVNHYFGYTCHLPVNVYIDGITLDKGTSFYILPNYNTGVDQSIVNGSENLNKLCITEKITILNLSSDYTFTVSKNQELYSSTEIINE